MAEQHKIHCPICLCAFREPKITPCGHTFCLHCIDRWTHQFLRHGEALLSFPCPTCQCFIPMPFGGPKHFTTNYAVVGDDSPGVNGARANQATRSKSVVDEKCKEHPDELCKLFCMQCNMTICHECIFATHKAHDMTSLKTLKESCLNDLKKHTEELLANYQRWEQFSTKLDSEEAALKETSSEVAQSVAMRAAFLKSKIDDIQVELLTQLDDWRSSEQQKLNDVKDKVHVVLSSLRVTMNYGGKCQDLSSKDLLAATRSLGCEATSMSEKTLPVIPAKSTVPCFRQGEQDVKQCLGLILWENNSSQET